MSAELNSINDALDFVFRFGPFWAYAMIAAACFVENFFPPFPGDTFIAAAGALAALDRIDFATAAVVIVASGMSSVMLVYAFGRNRGRGFFERRNYRLFSRDDIAAMDRRFARWGAGILLVSRFIVGVRVVVALAAGVSRYNPVRMLVFSTMSYLVFALLVMLAAYTLVDNLEVLADFVRSYNRFVVALLIIIVVAVILGRTYRRGRTNA